MEKGIQIARRYVDLPPRLEQEIHERIRLLERFYPRLIGCSVVVERPGRHHETGGPYRVKIDLRVPGGEPLIIDRQHEEKLDLAIGEAFDSATRRLEDYVRLQRGQVKLRESPAVGRVVKLFPERDYGFIEADDGREIYFHRNSVLDGGFDRLEIGSEVRFHEEEGLEGAQASTVHVR